MVACGKCQVQNTLDSSYCRRCGAELDADVLQEARTEVGRTVAQGFVLFNEGKIDDAALIAEMGVKEDPTLTTAISLKGMCHERRGELSEALDAYERVLELTPDSALDRIKVSQLRAAIAAKATIVEEERAKPDRKSALAAAVLAVMFFGGVGALTFRLISGSQSHTVVTSRSGDDTSVGTGFVDTPTAAPANAQPTSSAAGNATPTVSAVRPVESDTTNNPTRTTTTDSGDLPTARPIAPNLSGSLPDGTGHLDITPIESKTNVEPKLVDPDPKTETHAVATPQRPDQDPVDDPGQIEITVTNRTPKNIGGSQAADDPSTGPNLSKAASQEFQLKRYDSAAKKYERLLKSGGDSAHLNQRLAQCYENMGKKSEALGAYQRAAKALKASIESGHGNVARNKAALESCEAAIKVLNEGA